MVRHAIQRTVFAMLLLVCAIRASAQGTPRERVAVDAALSLQTTSTTFGQTVTFEAYSETGSLITSYSITQHPRFDASGVVRAWHGFAVGVSGTSMRGTDPAQITGEIPHPINANSPRALAGTTGAYHRETAVHLQAVYWFQPLPRIDVLVGAGPSFMHMEQDFVSDVSYSQSFPYDTVTFSSATLSREQKNATGFNAGGRVGARLVGHVGVSGLVRYSRATLDFSEAGASAVKLGGLEVGGGLHLTF